jgi:imidazolonepropionase-like amidohydrolase
MQAAGLTPMEVLVAATRDAARAMGREKDLGTIEAGKLADLIAIDGDPIANIANTTKVKKVVANGRVYDVAELVKRGQ